jgi:hypothetical protein
VPAATGVNQAIVGVDVTKQPGGDIGAQINNACGTGSNILALLPAGTFAVSTQILITTGCWIRGQGKYFTTLTAGGPIGANAIIHAAGTGGGHISKVRISDLSIKNGTPTSGAPTAGKDGIRLDYCDHCELDHLFVTNIQGFYGIVTKNSAFVSIHDNDVTQLSAHGIMTLSGGQYIDIFRNNLDTNLSTVSSIGIGIGSSEDVTLLAPLTNHGWVRDNTVLNFPNSECFDTHGGFDQSFENNICVNSYIGIRASTINDATIYDVLEEVKIHHNTVIRGTGKANGFGIIIAGTDLAHRVLRASIDDNYVYGYGSTGTASDATAGAIELFDADWTKITNNQIAGFWQAGITLSAGTNDTVITQNRFGDSLGGFSATTTADVYFVSPGNWGVFIDGNIGGPFFPATNLPYFGILQGSQGNEFRLGPNNRFGFFNPAGSLCINFCPIFATHIPDGTETFPLNFEAGDTVYDTILRPAWTFSGPGPVGGGNNYSNIGYFSTDSTDVVSTVSIASAAKTITSLFSSAANIAQVDGANNTTLTLTGAQLYSGGEVLWLQGCTTATFMNGQNLTVTSVTSAPNTITGTGIAHAAYGPAADTCTVGGISGYSPFSWIPPKMNIVIKGAGIAGADLSAKVLSNDGTTLTLDTAASTTVSKAKLLWQPGTATPNVAQLMLGTGCTTGASLDAACTKTVTLPSPFFDASYIVHCSITAYAAGGIETIGVTVPVNKSTFTIEFRNAAGNNVASSASYACVAFR